ncbi:MAG: hypothetical protein F6K55_13890 [Moorea sp. SIO4A3]|nr:hypothetical protein [Moorena sp. SIO4A3]
MVSPTRALHQNKATLSYGNFKPAKTNVYNGSPLPVFKMEDYLIVSDIIQGLREIRNQEFVPESILDILEEDNPDCD